MLIAKDNQGQLISALCRPNRQKSYFCPACQQPVRLKIGKVMQPHFAHLSLQDCHFFHENESAQHLGLKAALYSSLSENHPVTVEKILPKIGQIADLFVGEKLALEIQCSRLSQERLRERTQAYISAGYQVRWLLGKELWLNQRLTALQKDFLYFSQNMGFHLWELDLERQQLRLKYLIYEDLFGRSHYLSKSLSFAEDLLTFLRLPYEKQALISYEVALHQNIGRRIQRQLLARNPRWMHEQSLAYEAGDNLLVKADADFYPQVRPPKSKTGFAQIQLDLLPFNTAFEQYYQEQEIKTVQRLYPPAFYGKMIKDK
ncbi:competence protein CoiA [Streptococcus dentiloxodontae]